MTASFPRHYNAVSLLREPDRQMNKLGSLFLKGLVVVIPATLTVAILWWLARGAERLLGGLLARFLPEGWYVPGMGLVAALAITVLIGLLSHVWIFQELFSSGDRLLNRLPLVKSIYSATCRRIQTRQIRWRSFYQ